MGLYRAGAGLSRGVGLDVEPGTRESEGMTEAEFLAAFEDGTLQEDFTHRSHVHMAWLMLRADGRNRGTERILAGLRRFTAAKGAEAKFHLTLTLVWIRLVEAALVKGPVEEGSSRDGSKDGSNDGSKDGFDAFLAAHPELNESGLPFRYYSRELLMGDEARGRWVDPDLAALP